MDLIRNLLIEDDGQGMTEYALVLAVIAIGVVVVLSGIGAKILSIFTNVGAEVNKVP